MKILFVEDDQTIALGLSFSLKEEGYEVLHCENFASAMKVVGAGGFDFAILDLGLPDGNGYDICKAIKRSRDVPVIFLTAADDEVNVVMGLEYGADDYVTKPFRLRELLSRIKTICRRYDKASDQLYHYGPLELNALKAKVSLKGQEIFLSALEYRILLMLMQHQGQVLSREQLLEGIWDIDGQFVSDNTLSVYIKRLRDKLEGDVPLIHTLRGLGYRLGE